MTRHYALRRKCTKSNNDFYLLSSITSFNQPRVLQQKTNITYTREKTKTTQSIEKKVSVTPSCRLVISIRLCRTWFVEPQTYRMRYSSKNMCVSGVWSCKREEINHKVMLITTNYGQSNRIEHKTTRDHIIFGTKYALCREIRSISFM